MPVVLPLPSSLDAQRGNEPLPVIVDATATLVGLVTCNSRGELTFESDEVVRTIGSDLEGRCRRVVGDPASARFGVELVGASEASQLAIFDHDGGAWGLEHTLDVEGFVVDFDLHARELAAIIASASGPTRLRWWHGHAGRWREREPRSAGRSGRGRVSDVWLARFGGRGTSLWVADARGSVHRLDARASSQFTLRESRLSDSGAAPHDMAIDADAIYLATFFGIERAPKAGERERAELALFEPALALFRASDDRRRIGYVTDTRMGLVDYAESTAGERLWSAKAQLEDDAPGMRARLDAVRSVPVSRATLRWPIFVNGLRATTALTHVETSVVPSPDFSVRPQQIWLSKGHSSARNGPFVTLINSGRSPVVVRRVELSRTLERALKIEHPPECVEMAAGSSLVIGLAHDADHPATPGTHGWLAVHTNQGDVGEFRVPIVFAEADAIAEGSSPGSSSNASNTVQPSARLVISLASRALTWPDEQRIRSLLGRARQRLERISVVIEIPEQDTFLAESDDPWPRVQAWRASFGPFDSLRGGERRAMALDRSHDDDVVVRLIDAEGTVRATVPIHELAHLDAKLWIVLDEMQRQIAPGDEPELSEG